MQSLDDLMKQCRAVNLAFEHRIDETLKAKTKLEDHLAKVILNLMDFEGSIDPHNNFFCPLSC
jgi:tektin-1